MVRKGEYLERAVVLPGEPPLEGLYHRGKKSLGVLILPPGPERGGMETPLIAEIAWAVTRTGHPTLRLNYPGVGASSGNFDLASARRSARRGLEHLQACMSDVGRYPELGFVGHGMGAVLGAELAVEVGDCPVFMVQPDVKMLGELSRAGLRGETVVVAAEEDSAEDKRCWRSWVNGGANGRLMVVPEADPVWRRRIDLVGRAASELFSPPGLIDFGD